jgi:CYTH domain-containing protein
MPDEIERKFVVPPEHHHLFVDRPGGTEILQAYLSTSPDATVRVRTIDV